MQMMIDSSIFIGKLSVFKDVDDTQSMAVCMGYFYGFLMLRLNRDAYTNAKTEFVKKYTEKAKSIYGNRY